VTEPLWLDLADVLDIHGGQLASFGGLDGIRDETLIESALLRPQNMFYYENVEDALLLAIRLGVGLAKNHGFIDGNKRTGAVAMIEFLAINGYVLQYPGNDSTFGVLFEAAVTNRMTEEEFAETLYPYLESLEPYA
jgi:death-on-curing protein